MIQDDIDENHTEYEEWSLPGSDSKENRPDEFGDRRTDSEGKNDDWGPPPTMREPLLRDRFRNRLGLSHRQWYIIEAVLIALPYPFFVAVYVLFSVNETLFIVGTLAYSLIAMYAGFIS